MSDSADIVERLEEAADGQVIGQVCVLINRDLLREAAERLRRPSASPEAPVTSSHMPSHHVAHAGNMVEPEALEAARRLNAAIEHMQGKRLAVAFKDEESARHVGLIIENAVALARALLSTKGE